MPKEIMSNKNRKFERYSAAIDKTNLWFLQCFSVIIDYLLGNCNYVDLVICNIDSGFWVVG